MGRACCVLGCPSGGDAPSHQIPKNPVLFQKWKNMIYSEKIQHLTDEQISKCAVCYRHFADNDYLVTFRVRKLKRGIIPSLNLPNKLTSDVIKIEPQISATSMSTFTTNEVMESQKLTGVPETAQNVPFPDTPEKNKFCLFDRPQTLPNKHIKRTNSTAEMFKLNCREKASRKKQVKSTAMHSSLLRCKQQAKQYEKTPTIQKLLSFLTIPEITFIKTRIRKSKYSPKVYVKVYHNIAKRKALGFGQL
ncbi:PREDICTED: uncharacterized protein LOC105565795 [Vollenhovia emeryi]|uniref:uncharacterized protein LOC105565795 n=1 Tax=Vollenhovia emeryi TaxID=411798 RepID=UPI0005F3F66D|nr:PREDICTED: uncharacterized protein LOC105565795 [Vollenhovia emeryi]